MKTPKHWEDKRVRITHALDTIRDVKELCEAMRFDFGLIETQLQRMEDLKRELSYGTGIASEIHKAMKSSEGIVSENYKHYMKIRKDFFKKYKQMVEYLKSANL
jgi:hypothetical protein